MNTDLLIQADALLLAPAGLDEPALSGVLADMLTHQVDYADLYFQYTRGEGWSLDEGIVKSGSFHIDQGVGVRAVAGEKTAFAYSDEISLPALRRAAGAVRAIAASGGSGQTASPRVVGGRGLYLPQDPIASLDAAAKVATLEKLERLARARDPRVVQVMASLAAEWDVVYIARHDGVRAADIRPLVRLSVTVIAEQNGRRESYAHIPMPRMTNTYMQGGAHSQEEIIASVKDGLYAVNFGGGQVDITSGKFVFSAAEAWMIENGKLAYPVKGATLIGNGPDVLNHVDLVGHDLALDPGVGTCGKEGQGVPVGVGQPTVRISGGLTVGGTA